MTEAKDNGFYHKLAPGGVVASKEITIEDLKKRHPQYGMKAALFGVDKYKIPGADLAGCVNDVYDMASTLLQMGWRESNIHIITNERATSKRWLKEMKWLTDKSGPGDVRLFMQSSHGTNKHDYSGDEADKRDEMIVMHDFSWDDETTHVTDDDIKREFVDKVHPETRCEVILDTCHSGTGSRSLVQLPVNTRVKYLRNPDQQLFMNRTLPTEEKRKWFGNSVVDKDISGKQVANNGIIYGCQDFDVSYETAQQINGQWIVRGLMTFNLCNILRETILRPLTRRELGKELRGRVSAEAQQNPGYECFSEEYYNQYPFRRGHQDDPSEAAI